MKFQDGKKKYFKRSDLLAQEAAEYLEKHGKRPEEARSKTSNPEGKKNHN